jgi:kynurenine formamidase
LIGPYRWVDLDHCSPAILEKSGGKDQHILFLTGSSQVEISQKTFNLLLKLPCRVWVTVHEIRIAGQEPLYFHKTLFKASKYLVEDIDETQGSRVKPGGEIVILPLRLKEAVGSPCRVVVRQKSP